MATSRTVMTVTQGHQKTSLATSTMSAPRTRNLSANGSRNAPDEVTPKRRASMPSMPSVMHSIHHSRKVGTSNWRRASSISTTGVMATRSMVTPLAGVISALVA